MAFSGGSGTEIDPYILTTRSDITAMNAGHSGNYFKLGADIEMLQITLPLIGQKIDGDGHRLYRWYKTSGNFTSAPATGSELSNLKIEFSNEAQVAPSITPTATPGENVVFRNIHFKYSQNSVSVMFGNYRTSWTFEDLTIEGARISFILPTQSGQNPVLNRVSVSIISSTLWFGFCAGSATCKPSYYNCSVYVFNTNLAGTFTNRAVFGSWATIVEGCYVRLGQYSSDNSVCLVSTAEDVVISNNRIDIERVRPIINLIQPELGDYGGMFIVSRTIQPTAVIENNVVNIIDYNFEGLGSIDSYFSNKTWFIPSVDELQLILDIRTNTYFSSEIRSNWASSVDDVTSRFLPWSSSCVSQTHATALATSGSVNLPKTSYASLVLCTNLTDIPAEVQVGDLYEDLVVIYKSGTNGIGAARRPLFTGGRAFTHSSDSITGPSATAVGTGEANTSVLSATKAYAYIANWQHYQVEGGYKINFVSPNYNVTSIRNYVLTSSKVESDLSSLDLATGVYTDTNIIHVSSSNISNEESYPDLDFVNKWEMVNGFPIPRLGYAVSFDDGYSAIGAITKLSSTSFSVRVGLPYNIGSPFLRVLRDPSYLEIYEESGYDHIVEFDRGTRANLWLIPYSTIGETEKVELALSYFFDGIDEVELTTVEVEEYIPSLSKDGKIARLVHGNVIANGKHYGSPRGIGQSGFSQSSFAIMPINDYSSYSLLKVEAPGDTGNILYNLEAIVKIGDYLFSMGYTTPGSSLASQRSHLVMINSLTDTYKIFRMPFNQSAGAPLATDGTFLYIDNGQYFIKMDPNDFIEAPNQFYIGADFIPSNYMTEGWSYFKRNGGPAVVISGITGAGQAEYNCHAAIVDSQYVFFAQTTGSLSGGFNLKDTPGWEKYHGAFYLVALNKNTMAEVGWCLIPQTTDDMAQDENWLYFGQEVLFSGAYGENYGVFAINKQSLIEDSYLTEIKALPQLHSTDTKPSRSYASVVFGNYLIDLKVNKRVYAIDKSDPSQWSLDANVGEFTTHTFRLVDSSQVELTTGPVNEIAVDDNGLFHGFLWNTNSGATAFYLPGITAFAPPTMQASYQSGPLVFTGYLLDSNGKVVTEVGFEWGNNPDPETWTQSQSATLVGSDFSYNPGLTSGNWYFRAYGINSEGTGYSDVITVELGATIPTVSSVEATVSGTSVTLTGSVSDNGGEAPASSGFYYGTSSGNLNQSTSNDGTLPAISKVLNGLSPGTYYFRAFAQNSAGTGLGSILSFTILEPAPDVETPTVTTGTPNPIGTSVTLNGSVVSNGGEAPISSGFYYGTSSGNLNQSASNDATLPAISKVLNGLSPGTYYFRAFAQNSAGIGLGSIQNFTIQSQELELINDIPDFLFSRGSNSITLNVLNPIEGLSVDVYLASSESGATFVHQCNVSNLSPTDSIIIRNINPSLNYMLRLRFVAYSSSTLVTTGPISGPIYSIVNQL